VQHTRPNGSLGFGFVLGAWKNRYQFHSQHTKRRKCGNKSRSLLFKATDVCVWVVYYKVIIIVLGLPLYQIRYLDFLYGARGDLNIYCLNCDFKCGHYRFCFMSSNIIRLTSFVSHCWLSRSASGEIKLDRVIRRAEKGSFCVCCVCEKSPQVVCATRNNFTFEWALFACIGCQIAQFSHNTKKRGSFLSFYCLWEFLSA
jgi:hypothetical protein